MIALNGCPKWDLRVLIILVSGWMLNSAAEAQPILVVYTDWGRIERFSSAWRDDAMAVHHSAPFVNSHIREVLPTGFPVVRDACTTINDGYATDPSDPGRKLHHAMIIGAFLHNKQVRLVLEGCAYDKPRIIAVEVRD